MKNHTKSFSVENNVLYEDNHLVIVNKPAGMLIQGDSTGDKPLVEHVRDYIRIKFNKPGNVFCGVVHRLDRPVSGVVVFARTSKALERMNKLFRDREIHKTYWEKKKKRPQEKKAKLVHYLMKDPAKNTTKAFAEDKEGASRAELFYSVLGKLNDHFLLEVSPVTGRPHQIRVQLSTIGSPIRGDLKYGFPVPNTDKSINLHARRLNFVHPIKKEKMLVVAPLPENPFWEQFLTLDNLSDKDLNKMKF